METFQSLCQALHISFKCVVDIDYIAQGGDLVPDLSEDQMLNVHEMRELERILPNIEDELLKKFLDQKVLKVKMKDKKKCLASKILEKMSSDSDYNLQVLSKITDLRKDDIFVLQYGMLEHYFDKD